MASLVPCKRCGFTELNAVHLPKKKCRGCKAPHDHHAYDPEVIVLTRWHLEDIEKGRTVEIADYFIRKQTQAEEDAENE